MFKACVFEELGTLTAHESVMERVVSRPSPSYNRKKQTFSWLDTDAVAGDSPEKGSFSDRRLLAGPGRRRCWPRQATQADGQLPRMDRITDRSNFNTKFRYLIIEFDLRLFGFDFKYSFLIYCFKFILKLSNIYFIFSKYFFYLVSLFMIYIIII